jgi:hypothetical protein
MLQEDERTAFVDKVVQANDWYSDMDPDSLWRRWLKVLGQLLRKCLVNFKEEYY